MVSKGPRMSIEHMVFDSPVSQSGLSYPAQNGVGVVVVAVVEVTVVVVPVVVLLVHALHRTGQMTRKASLAAQNNCDARAQSVGSVVPRQLGVFTTGVFFVVVVSVVVVGQVPQRVLHRLSPRSDEHGSNSVAVQPIGSCAPSHSSTSG